jgi:hypothetical protein
MPVYQTLCPDCGHHFSGMVFAGSREPEKWVCSQCGGDRTQIRPDSVSLPHPLELQHGTGCPCCSGGGATLDQATRYAPVETREVHDADAASAFFLQLFEQ